jgi:predicted ATPase/DNA-binding SARP family transcriptional activator
VTTERRLRIDVLGPLRVVDAEDRDVTPPGSLQRRLLALLVLRRGRAVTADSAIEALWPSARPDDPVAALQNHLFRLRRALPQRVIESIADGYRLDPTQVVVDADGLATALGNAGGDGDDLAGLDAVLARWQGPAYPELDDLDDGRDEAARLEELRCRALERRAEIRLATGTTDGLAAELSALADAEPLRERPRALLMTALAVTGRQAEALRVFDDFRRVLGAELGIEPSPELAAQRDALLAGEQPRSWSADHHLPVPTTSLIGRDDLADELFELAHAHRVVTLVGPGGVGKTRLLIETGHRLRDARPDDSIVLCELAGADARSAVDVVAAALDIDSRPRVAPVDRIVDVVRDTPVVLLLDNCEHVLDAVAAFVDAALVRCANVRVVATSRERLRVPGEHVRIVPTLPWGADHAPAIQLFVERARAVVPGFAPTGNELAAVTDIVNRLDGLPLAIELAAARLHTHDVDEVAAGLDRHRFALLESGYRTSSRHASLGAAVSWSYGLLDDPLKETFANLSVFAGSFDADDAAAVCAADAAVITTSLAQLVERSLVMRTEGRRYVLLETLRAFGAEQLVLDGRDDPIAERHARHFVEWIEHADTWLSVPGRRIVPTIDAVIPELRSAFAWLVERGEVELAGRLVSGLLDYGILRLRPDVLAWSERVIEADPDDRSPFAARVLVASAYAAWMAGDVAETRRRSSRALLVTDRVGGAVPAEVPTVRGSVALFEGELEEAVSWYQRGVDLAGESDPQQRLMASASQLLALGYAGDPSVGERAELVLASVAGHETPYAAYTWYCAGEAMLSADTQLARARFVRALELAELTNTSFVIGVAGASKASLDARTGDPETAAADYRRLIMHWRRAGMWSTQWTMLRSIAGLLDRLGRPDDAAVLEGAVRASAAGHRIFGADEIALNELGAHLRDVLGDGAYESARERGAMLDGDAAVEHALRAL